VSLYPVKHPDTAYFVFLGLMFDGGGFIIEFARSKTLQKGSTKEVQRNLFCAGIFGAGG
jgi:hypothetical protein